MEENEVQGDEKQNGIWTEDLFCLQPNFTLKWPWV